MDDVAIPPFLAGKYKLERVAPMQLSALRALLRLKDGGMADAPLEHTPHFAYARALITGAPEQQGPYWPSYEAYFAHVAASSGKTQPDAHVRFSALLHSIRTHGYGAGPHARALILALPAGARYRILDGLHRAATLRALDHETAAIGILE